MFPGMESPAMTNRRKWIRGTLAAGTGGFALEQLWRHGHDYVFPKEFVVVEPGKIYRGAWQKPWPMRSIIHDRKIRTILALAHPSDHHLAIQEKRLADELGVKWIHIPIVDNRVDAKGSAEEAISDQLDKAASVLADPANYPIYFHCHHGLNRASMTQIAYRTKYCGWTLAKAADEIERSVGLVKVTHGPDYRHMMSYYENRVLKPRLRESQADQSPPAEIAADTSGAPARQ